jgi:hypothetical protein
MSTEANPTALSPRSPSPGLLGALPSERSLWSLIGCVALVALWFLRRRYNGVLHDSMIYTWVTPEPENPSDRRRGNCL